MEKLIRKWWFYAFCIIVFFMPSIVQQPVTPEKTSLVIQEVMQKPLIYKVDEFFPIAKALLVFLLIGGLIWGNKFRRVFALLFSFLSFFMMIFQNISLETEFGYAILLGNIILQSVVVLSWVYEARVTKNDFSEPIVRWWNMVLFILAFFAFWMPALDGRMQFSIRYLFMNEAGLTYCMVTPVILSILLLYYPKINKAALRITSFIGLLFGIVNMVTWFVLNTGYWWMGVVHFPLLIISCVGLVLSKKISYK